MLDPETEDTKKKESREFGEAVFSLKRVLHEIISQLLGTKDGLESERTH